MLALIIFINVTLAWYACFLLEVKSVFWIVINIVSSLIGSIIGSLIFNEKSFTISVINFMPVLFSGMIFLMASSFIIKYKKE